MMCNWLVCLGVWQATAAQDIIGKIVGIFCAPPVYCSCRLAGGAAYECTDAPTTPCPHLSADFMRTNIDEGRRCPFAHESCPADQAGRGEQERSDAE